MKLEVGDLVRPLGRHVLGTEEEQAIFKAACGIGTVLSERHTYLNGWEYSILWSDGEVRNGPGFAYERVGRAP